MSTRLLLLVALALSLSCGEDAVSRTQVLLLVDAEPAVRTATQRLVVSLSSGPVSKPGAWKTHAPETFTDFRWPASLALVPSGDPGDTGFEVRVTAYDASGSKAVESRVISSFVKLRTLLLKVVLDDVCLAHSGCGEALTCAARDGLPVCVSAMVDPKDLPEYTGPKSAGGNMFGDGGTDEPDASGDGDGDGDGDSDGDDGPCVPNGAESCFNGKDDDCNGATDCEDSACTPTSMCVPGGSTAGVFVGADEACPEGYTASEQVLHSGLSGGGCEGCSCNVTPTGCTANFYGYATADECTGDVYNSQGTFHAITHFNNTSTDPDDTNCPNPVEPLNGWRVTTIVPNDGTCSPSGTSLPETPAWAQDGKLCKPASVGKGCDAGHACLPKLAGAVTCHHDDAIACASAKVSWYDGIEDDRTCGSCRCVDGTGGNCTDVKVKVGSDWGCNVQRGLLGANEKQCAYSYSPPVFLVGNPVDKSCIPMASVSGSLKPAGKVDLCCSGP